MFVLIITILVFLLVIGLVIFGFFYKNRPNSINVNPNSHKTKRYCAKNITTCDLKNDNCGDVCIENETGVEMSCNPTGDGQTGVCSEKIPQDSCNTENGALPILTAWGGNGPPEMSWDCFCSEPDLAGGTDCALNPNFCDPNLSNNGVEVSGGVLNSTDYQCNCAPGSSQIDRGDGKPTLCVPGNVDPQIYINSKSNYSITSSPPPLSCEKNSDCPLYNQNWVQDLNNGTIKPHSKIGICSNNVCTIQRVPDYKSACDWAVKNAGSSSSTGTITSNPPQSTVDLYLFGQNLWNTFNEANRKEDLVYCVSSDSGPCDASCQQTNAAVYDRNLKRIRNGTLQAPNVKTIYWVGPNSQNFAMSDLYLPKPDNSTAWHPDPAFTCQEFCDNLQRFNGDQTYNITQVGTPPDCNSTVACNKFCSPLWSADSSQVARKCADNIMIKANCTDGHKGCCCDKV